MNKKSYRYTYGPVSSWRLGSSLGVDPISGMQKVCNFDCVYCQLGRTKEFADERRNFVPFKDVAEEVREIASVTPIDYITFSGAGEPTLAKNLGEMIKAVKKIRREKIAVITNSSLIDHRDVREDLSFADFVLAKLDVCDPDLFRRINRPTPGIDFERIMSALKSFKAFYHGRFALQIMFVPFNLKSAERIAELAKEIHPHEIQLNTPLRKCSAKAIPRTDLEAVEKCFRSVCGNEIEIINVYQAKRKKVASVSEAETLRRRGKDNGKGDRHGRFYADVEVKDSRSDDYEERFEVCRQYWD